MGVNTGVSGSSSEVLAFSEWNMLSIRVFVALSKTKINDIDIVLIVLLTTD
jgi:hypothetical protein